MISRQTQRQAGLYLIGALLALALDALTMILLVYLKTPLILARGVALTLGITTTYLFNRRYTFDTTHEASFKDWIQYVFAQSIGAAINFGVSTLAIIWLGRSSLQVALGVCAGAALGFSYNFFAARHLLHRRDLRDKD